MYGLGDLLRTYCRTQELVHSLLAWLESSSKCSVMVIGTLTFISSVFLVYLWEVFFNWHVWFLMERSPVFLNLQVLVGGWRYFHPATEDRAFKSPNVSDYLWQQQHKWSSSRFFHVQKISLWLHFLWSNAINESGSLERGEEPRWAWKRWCNSSPNI